MTAVRPEFILIMVMASGPLPCVRPRSDGYSSLDPADG